jgi:serine/threonine-protein kinase
MLRSDGRLVIFDFGLAVPDQPAFLQPGNRVGTPQYMAPEVVRRRQADRRLDMFSLGVTAYEICTRRLPWGAAKSGSGAAALAHDSPPDDIRSHWPEIPPSLAAAVQACIAANPAVRPATTEAFLRLFANVPAST